MRPGDTMKTFLKAAILAGLMMPGIASAQFSDSYNFLKAVRERDGAKVNDIISKPGSVLIDTRDQSSGESALHIVTRDRDATWMRFLLARGARTDMRDGRGNTPLMIAAQIGFLEGAQLLLGRRASVDLANSAGETPLIIAVQNRDTPMVQFLMQSGANPNKPDTSAGLSARDYAIRDRRSAAILKILETTRPTAGAVVAPKPAGPK